jgi:hypothetical protein
MIHGELGRCPLHIDIKQGMCHTGPNVKQENSKKCAVVHRLVYRLRNTQNAISSWLNSVQTILDECDFSYIWDTQIFICEIWLKFNIKVRLHDQFQQTWREKVTKLF